MLNMSSKYQTSSFLRLAGIMVDLISQNQPSSLDAFIINFQSGVRFLTRTLPVGLLNKGNKNHYSNTLGQISLLVVCFLAS